MANRKTRQKGPFQAFRVRPGTLVKLNRFDPADTGGLEDSDAAAVELASLKAEMAGLQQMLWADQRYAMLVVFQAMDAGGKDGAIRHVLSGLNPQGCRVTSFKAPTSEELAHDYLWRIHEETPPRGMIGVFNRSHYEDVLVVRVRSLVPQVIWKARYDQINHFEERLSAEGTLIVKFFLHVSKAEQERRFLKRLLDPKKNWKFLHSDLVERAHWKQYMRAYEDALTRCSTPWAPWFVIPADRKWYRDLAVARILTAALRGLPLRWPKPTAETRRLAALARKTGRVPQV